MAKPKVLVLLGQTATGKSDLAVKLARKLKGEIVSADSRQVYKYLNVGSGKITNKEMRGVPHHLLDVANPKTRFTVAEYQQKAVRALDEILSRGGTPIICGGTGFYIDAITRGFTLPEVPPNPKLRTMLNKKNTEELFDLLKKLDSARAENIDKRNKVRLVRAIEVAKALGQVPRLALRPPNYKFIKVGLRLEDDELKNKIEKRLIKRLPGIIKEGKNLRRIGLSLKRMLELGLEYRHVALFLQKKVSKQEMAENLAQDIWQFAKRQKTWFKRDKTIRWFSPKEYREIEEYTLKQF